MASSITTKSNIKNNEIIDKNNQIIIITLDLEFILKKCNAVISCIMPCLDRQDKKNLSMTSTQFLNDIRSTVRSLQGKPQALKILYKFAKLEIFNMISQDCDIQDFQDLNLDSCKKLHTINLLRNRIGISGIEEIGNAFILKCPQIQNLNFKGNRLGPTGAEKISECLVNDKALKDNNLKSLDLSDNCLGEEGGRAVSNIIRKASLHSIIITGNSICERGATAIASGLSKKEIPSELKVIGMDSTHIGVGGAKAIAGALISKAGKSIEFLSLAWNGIGSQGVISISEALEIGPSKSCLKVLNLSRNRIGSEGGEAIGKAMKSEFFPSLHHLNLSSNNIAAEGAISIANALENGSSSCHLKILNLASNNIEKEGGMALGIALQSAGDELSLKSIYLNDNNLGSLGILEIALALEKGYPPLLENVNLSDNYASKEGAKILSKSLSSPKLTTNLQFLNLRNNFMGPQAGRDLLESIQFSNISTLDISGNGLSPLGGLALAEIVIDKKFPKNIKILNISSNSIGDEAISRLMNAFSVVYEKKMGPESLRTIHLGRNDIRIGDEASQSIQNFRSLDCHEVQVFYIFM